MSEDRRVDQRIDHTRPGRRRFVEKAALAGGAATLAGLSGCGVASNNDQAKQGTGAASGGGSSMPEVRLKFQGAFFLKDPMFEIATGFYRFIEELSDGRMTGRFFCRCCRTSGLTHCSSVC